MLAHAPALHESQTPPVFTVRGLEVHARVIGAGHRAATLELQLDAGQVMHFAICDAHVASAVAKLFAFCRARGIAVDTGYRPLEVKPAANGDVHGHTKQLPVLPIREKPEGDARPAPVRVAPVADERLAEAWRRFSTGEEFIARLADALGLKAPQLRQRFSAHYGVEYDHAAKLWMRWHFRPQAERQQLFAEDAANRAIAAAPTARNPVTKPGGALL